MRLDRDKIPTIEQIRERFAPVLKVGGAKKAIVFGSYARGGPDEYSDLDLIIVSDTEGKFIKRADELSKMLAEGRYFIERALEEGVVIYEE